MSRVIDLKHKFTFVDAIKNGLYIAKIEVFSSEDVVKSRIPYVKIDKICNSIIKSINDKEHVRYVICQRSWYPVLFVYDAETKTIYSFMRSSRFRSLINRIDLSHAHYIDSLVEFNLSEESDEQLILNDDFKDRDDINIQKLKNQIVDMLGGETPDCYVTVCYDLDKFRLCKVEAFITSESLHIIARDNWSDIIGVDYNEIIDIPSTEPDDDNNSLDLNITLKKDYPTPHEDDYDIDTKNNEDFDVGNEI